MIMLLSLGIDTMASKNLSPHGGSLVSNKQRQCALTRSDRNDTHQGQNPCPVRKATECKPTPPTAQSLVLFSKSY